MIASVIFRRSTAARAGVWQALASSFSDVGGGDFSLRRNASTGSDSEGEEIDLASSLKMEIEDETENPKEYPDLPAMQHALPFDVTNDAMSSIIKLTRTAADGEVIQVSADWYVGLSVLQTRYLNNY